MPKLSEDTKKVFRENRHLPGVQRDVDNLYRLAKKLEVCK